MSKCLNVAMTQCFWCGEADAIIIGKNLVDCKDEWNPKYVFAGYEPCDSCKEKMSLGFTVMIASTKPVAENQPEIQKGVYPTGQWIVLDKRAPLAQSTDGDRCFMDTETAKHTGLL